MTHLNMIFGLSLRRPSESKNYVQIVAKSRERSPSGKQLDQFLRFVSVSGVICLASADSRPGSRHVADPALRLACSC